MRERRLDEDLLRHFHEQIFRGVRSHAGRIRCPDFGSEYLIFGPHRSARRNDVPLELENVFERGRAALRSFDDNPDAPDFEANAVHLALWIHAEVIKIHPFEDGSGRTGRLLLNWTLVRLGLRPLAMEVTRPEYLVCLNRYYEVGDIAPLVDLCLRLYADALEP